VSGAARVGAAGPQGGLTLISRRGLLQAGLLGSAAVWAGGILSCTSHTGAAPGAAARAALSSEGEEILRAVAPAVLGMLLPASAAEREPVLEAAIARLDNYLSQLSLPLQKEAQDVFGTLTLWPVRVLLLGSGRRWSETSNEDVEAFLRSARQSRILLLRRSFSFLQSMVTLAYFDLPTAWKEVGYPGPLVAKPSTPESA